MRPLALLAAVAWDEAEVVQAIEAAKQGQAAATR